MSEEIGDIKIYAGRGCNKLIDTIEWDTKVIIALINGEKEILKNTASSGQTVSAIVYLKNESKWRFGIRNITFPDKRVKIKVEKSWVLTSPVKLTISFDVPENPTPDDVIKAGKVQIEGFYVYGER